MARLSVVFKATTVLGAVGVIVFQERNQGRTDVEVGIVVGDHSGRPMGAKVTPWMAKTPQTCFDTLFIDDEGTPHLPVVGGNSRCAWLVQDAHSHFHKWRVMKCAEPSNLSASGSQAVEREQHLTGRNKQRRYLDLQAKLFRGVDGLFNVRVDGSIESGVRGRDWGQDRGVGYPVLTRSLDRCMCSYIDINALLSEIIQSVEVPFFPHSLASSTSTGQGYNVG